MELHVYILFIFDITNIDSPRLVNKTIFYDNNGISFLINHITISTIDDNTYAIASAAVLIIVHPRCHMSLMAITGVGVAGLVMFMIWTPLGELAHGSYGDASWFR